LRGTRRNQQLLHFIEDLTRAAHELNEHGSVLSHSDKPLRFVEQSRANVDIPF